MINWLRKIRFLILHRLGFDAGGVWGDYLTDIRIPTKEWSGYFFQQIDETGQIPQGWDIDLPWGHNDRGDHYTTYVSPLGIWFGRGSFEICYRAEMNDMVSRPAFWLLNLETETCEIDITEHFRSDEKFQVSYWYHYEPRKGWCRAIRSPKLFREMAERYFVYRLDWKKDRLEWYINGIKVAVYKFYLPVDKMAIVISGIKGRNIKWLKYKSLN